jgi:hypothetical protein
MGERESRRREHERRARAKAELLRRILVNRSQRQHTSMTAHERSFPGTFRFRIPELGG